MGRFFFSGTGLVLIAALCYCELTRSAAMKIYQVDAFTDKPFAGNPAGVCLLDQPADPAWMQNVAMEMNLAETAFLHPGDDGFHLRWFTPTVEVDLCGHATLASAHILYELGLVKPEATARFHSKSGLLSARKSGVWIELDFPATPARPIDTPPGLESALGMRALWAGQNQFDILVEVESEALLRGLDPDCRALKSLGGRGVIVTARAATPGYDFVSRFFAPCAGVDEDPVTGSAHCTLCPYWEAKLGKSAMIGYQASKRGGVVRVRREADRVLLGGQAVTVLIGQLT
jgi:PhzF family phenazine biosynthesis protein